MGTTSNVPNETTTSKTPGETGTPAPKEVLPPAPPADKSLDTSAKSLGFSDISKRISEFWQLATAIAGIVAAVIGGISYFASQHEVAQVDCRASQKFLVADLESRIAQVSADIQEEEGELRLLTTAQSQDVSTKELIEIKNKKVEAARNQKITFNSLLQTATNQLSQSVCSPSKDGNIAEKKP